MKSAFLVLSLSLVTGCAFQKSDPKQESATIIAPEYQLRFNWNKSANSSPDEPSAARALQIVGDAYSSNEAVTLPISAPEKLHLEGTVQAAHFSSEPAVKVSISFGERAISLPAKITATKKEGTKEVLTLEVTGIDTAFKIEKSSTGKLILEISDTAGHLIRISTVIRTPPSSVAAEAMTLAEFSAQEDSRDFDFVSPTVLGQELNLVRVVKLTNNENTPIELHMPLTPSGGVMQTAKHYSLRQAECSYTRQATETYSPISSKFLILPLNERFLEQAEAGIRDNEGNLTQLTTLQPGATASFGLYGVGPKVSHWLKHGPQTSELSSTRAVSACGSVCSQRVCEPTPGAGGGRHGVTGCTCEGYRRTYEYSDVTLGTERGAISLVFGNGMNTLSARFADLDPKMDREMRSIPFTPSSSELTR